MVRAALMYERRVGIPGGGGLLDATRTRYGRYVDAPAVNDCLVVAFERVGAMQFGEVRDQEGTT